MFFGHYFDLAVHRVFRAVQKLRDHNVGLRQTDCCALPAAYHLDLFLYVPRYGFAVYSEHRIVSRKHGKFIHDRVSGHAAPSVELHGNPVVSRVVSNLFKIRPVYYYFSVLKNGFCVFHAFILLPLPKKRLPRPCVFRVRRYIFPRR